MPIQNSKFNFRSTPTTMVTPSTTTTTTTTTDSFEDYEVINEIPNVGFEPDLTKFDIQDILRKELQKLMLQSQPQPPSKPPISIGTQINIQNLNIDLSQKSGDEEQCRAKNEPEGLFLGTDHSVDYEKLSNIVQNFYGGQDKSEEKTTHRKNSPMLIKFFE